MEYSPTCVLDVKRVRVYTPADSIGGQGFQDVVIPAIEWFDEEYTTEERVQELVQLATEQYVKEHSQDFNFRWRKRPTYQIYWRRVPVACVEATFTLKNGEKFYYSN